MIFFISLQYYFIKILLTNYLKIQNVYPNNKNKIILDVKKSIKITNRSGDTWHGMDMVHVHTTRTHFARACGTTWRACGLDETKKLRHVSLKSTL